MAAPVSSDILILIPCPCMALIDRFISLVVFRRRGVYFFYEENLIWTVSTVEILPKAILRIKLLYKSLYNNLILKVAFLLLHMA